MSPDVQTAARWCMERLGKDVAIRRLGSQCGPSKAVETCLEYIMSSVGLNRPVSPSMSFLIVLTPTRALFSRTGGAGTDHGQNVASLLFLSSVSTCLTVLPTKTQRIARW